MFFFFKIRKRCPRCLHLQRNDGTDSEPKWVCNDPNCVLYVPKKENNTSEETKEAI